MTLPFSSEMQDGQWNSSFFDTVGDESGSIDMKVDGSVTPQRFYITPPADRTYYIHRFVGLLVDSGSIDSGGFGNGPALTNGIDLWYTDNAGFSRVLTTQSSIKTSVDFAAYAYDITHHNWGLGDEALAWRFTITREGSPFRLLSGHSLYWQINDNLTGLSKMTIRCGMVSVPNQYKGR